MSNSKYTIAIIDEEENERETFINYFESTFDIIELKSLENIEELIDIIRSEQIDAVAIDYKLMDHGNFFKHNGDYFFKEVHEILTDFPAFILTNDPEQAKRESSKINPFYILDKGRMDITKPELRSDVFNIIKNYQESVQEKIAELKQLSKVKEEKGLDPNQEDRYVELSSILDNIIDKKDSISRTFYSNDTNKRLDEIINNTEKILNKLSGNNGSV